MTTATVPDISTPSRSSWLPAFAANVVIWGASFIFIKVGVSQLHPTWVAAFRLIAGALTLLAILYLTGQRLPRDRRLWLHMLVPGFLGSAVPFTLFAYGEERIASVVAGIWNATTAMWVLPVAVLVFRTEKFTTSAAVGLGVGFLGVVTVLGPWDVDGNSAVSGQLMCAAAAVCYGVSIPYLKRFVTGRTGAGAPPSGVALAALQCIIGAVGATAAALLLAGPSPAPATLSWNVIGSVLLLGVFGSGIAFALNMRVITTAGASTAAYVTYLVPVVATLLGIILLDETLTWNQPVGAAIVLIGVAIAQGLLTPRRSTK